MWTEECQNSFETLKQALLSTPILSYPDLRRNFILTCDASATAIGFVLGQLGRVIAYGGRSLTNAERKWSTSEQEMLAVLEGIRSYCIYLSDKKFTIHTDHKALKYVMDQKRATGRLARWAMEIQGYQFDIINRPEKHNEVADALSRREYPSLDSQEQHKEACVSTLSADNKVSLPLTESTVTQTTVDHTNDDIAAAQPEDNDISEPTQITFFYNDTPDICAIDPEIEISFENPDVSNMSKLSELQHNCPDFKQIYSYLANKTLPDDEKLQNKIIQTSKYDEICNGVLYHWFQRRVKCNQQFEDKWIQQLALPRELRLEALKAYHDNSAGGAHLGIEKVMAAMKSKYHWPRMHQEIYDYIHSCGTCQRIKRDTHARPPPLTSLPVVGRFHRWHMDFLKLHKTNKGYQYVLLIVESFSKWVEAFPMKTQEAVIDSFKFFEF